MENLTLPVYELSIRVDQNIFTFLVNYLEGSNYLHSERKVNEFGVFKVSKCINGNTEIRFTPNREESIHFFKGLIDQLNDKQPPENLMMEIERILRRIDY